MSDPLNILTRREREVAAALANGWTYNRAGRELGISGETVRNHVQNIVIHIPSDFAPDAPMQRRVVLFYLKFAA